MDREAFWSHQVPFIQEFQRTRWLIQYLRELCNKYWVWLDGWKGLFTRQSQSLGFTLSVSCCGERTTTHGARWHWKEENLIKSRDTSTYLCVAHSWLRQVHVFPIHSRNPSSTLVRVGGFNGTHTFESVNIIYTRPFASSSSFLPWSLNTEAGYLMERQ